MTFDRDENPYQPPQSTEVVPTTMPGPAAMLLVTVASVGAWVFAFYGTCYGFHGIIRMFRNAERVVVFLVAGGIILPIPAAFLASRWVRRALLARISVRQQSPDKQRTPNDDRIE